MSSSVVKKVVKSRRNGPRMSSFRRTGVVICRPNVVTAVVIHSRRPADIGAAAYC
jgi:hypothetical protein